MSRVIRAAGLVALLGMAACTAYTPSNYRLPGERARSQTTADAVEMRDSAEQPGYVVLGKVHAHGRCNWFFGAGGCGDAQMRLMLREQAAKLGADAVINVGQDRFSSFEWNDVHYHGTAIVRPDADARQTREEPPPTPE